MQAFIAGYCEISLIKSVSERRNYFEPGTDEYYNRKANTSSANTTPTVVTGIHQMYTAIDLGQLAQYGVTYWRPIASAANIAQGGAALAVAFKTRDAKIKGLALPSALSVFMGITEPAIFGVNLRFFKPFIAGCIGGGCGALVCALTLLAASGTGVTGIFGILLCLAQPVQYAIMFAVAALVSFAISFVLYKDEPKASEQA